VMRNFRKIWLTALLVAAAVVVLAIVFPTVASTMLQFVTQLAPIEIEADLPPNLPPNFDKEDYMNRRAAYYAAKRGLHPDTIVDPGQRADAIRQMEAQLAARGDAGIAGISDPWVALGPAPIPNGQTSVVTHAVSGRTIAIAVHPSNPSIVYVGTAQGGLYRSTDGGANWTALMDNALSLAIGAIAIAPSQPDTVYVGTGEPNFSTDSFFGVGVYRIDNASTGSPVVSGPFNDDSVDADVFTGRAIAEIIVHPTLPGTIFVASTSGLGGIGGVANNTLPSRGIYRSTNATSADPTFAKLTGLEGNGNFNVRDIAIDPLNPNLLVANLVANGGGIYTSTNALAATPTFTRTATFSSSSTSELTAEFAVHSTGGTPTIYAATGNLGGRVLRSTDGGLTWPQRIDNNFCTAQCFYDIAIDVDPTNADKVYLGGSPTLIFGYSTNGGTSFTSSSSGLHVDTHAIAVAPSAPSTIYFGSDGGIWKSTDAGLNWTSLNNTQFSATQFMSVALHPTDRYFSIGGTQDNGTNYLRPDNTWTRSDFGDGGYAVIDQNAANTTNVTMVHTYFNQSNAMGYAHATSSTVTEGNWTLYGCGFSGSVANGMTCAASTILFYAPMQRGPGSPNTLYFGSDVLYRSANAGVTMVKVSQEPIQAAVAISAIGISPQDDNVRLIGQSNGNIFGTSTGSTTLTNLDASNAVPNFFIARAVIAPNSSTTAYVTLSAFGQPSVWKTTNLNAVNPTWAAASTGLPQVPVSAFVIDPANGNKLYAGTDIGVYFSSDAGANWVPFGTGLPRVAVFDMAIQPVHRKLRIATHGRGQYENSLVPNVVPFTDDPLVQQTSVVKAIHITELRTRVSALRTAYGLGAFSFTDPTLTAGATPIRAVHIADLRTALTQAYDAAKVTPPTFTDASLSGVVVKVVHINDLRTAVQSLEPGS
jgi:photosystem II stability/assembly factor-like uncharacterized protein